MRIGEVSDLTGLSAPTIRYYERLGLASAPPRRGRWRDYDARHVAELRTVKAAQALGFRLAELRSLSKQRGDATARAGALSSLLARIDSEISALRRRRKAAVAAAACECVDVSECAVLGALFE